MRQVNWTTVGESLVAPEERPAFLEKCERLEWLDASEPRDLPFMPGEAIKTMIREFRLPRVTQFGYSHECAPYGLQGVRCHWTNGSGEVFTLDTGAELVPIVSTLETSSESAAVRQFRALGQAVPS